MTNYVFLRNLIKDLHEDYASIKINFYLGEEKEKNLNQPLDVLTENVIKNHQIFSVSKNGYLVQIHVLNKQKGVFKYYLRKCGPALKQSYYIDLKEGQLKTKITDSLKDLFIEVFQILNNQPVIKNPDDLTSKILERLALPQDYLPHYMKLSIDDFHFQHLGANRLTPKWYQAHEFRLDVIMNNYKASIFNAEQVTIKDKFVLSYDSLIHYQEEQPETVWIDNDWEYYNYEENGEYLLHSDGVYTLNVYQMYGDYDARYYDTDAELVAAELDSITGNIEYAVTLLENIKNMEYDNSLIDEVSN